MTDPVDLLPTTGDADAFVTPSGHPFGAALGAWWDLVTALDSDRAVKAATSDYAVAHGAASFAPSLGICTWTFTVMSTHTGSRAAMEAAADAAETAWTPDPAAPVSSLAVYIPGRGRLLLHGHPGVVATHRLAAGVGVASMTLQWVATNPIPEPIGP